MVNGDFLVFCISHFALKNKDSLSIYPRYQIEGNNKELKFVLTLGACTLDMRLSLSENPGADGQPVYGAYMSRRIYKVEGNVGRDRIRNDGRFINYQNQDKLLYDIAQQVVFWEPLNMVEHINKYGTEEQKAKIPRGLKYPRRPCGCWLKHACTHDFYDQYRRYHDESKARFEADREAAAALLQLAAQ
jgi:hypothetical protein